MTAGRPSSYSADLALTICEHLADGKSLRWVCRLPGMPAKSTVIRWLSQHAEFQNQYAQCKAIGMDDMADETLEISDAPVGTLDNGATDSGAVAKQRLQVDTRKWYLSKLAPKIYGDRQAIDMSGNLALNSMSEDEIKAELATLVALNGPPVADDGSDLI